MNDNQFFKPTVLYKEYMILDILEKNPKTTQREISKTIGIAVSMVNDYLDQYEKDKLIRREKHSTKTVEYFVTKKGIEKRKLLNIWYLEASYHIYHSAKDDILVFLNQIIEKGFKEILFYGAGEVAEIILDVINDDHRLPLKVLAVIDDDVNKKGEFIVNLPIIQKEDINQYKHDGILVSSYTHHVKIKEKLENINYPMNQVLEFFK